MYRNKCILMVVSFLTFWEEYRNVSSFGIKFPTLWFLKHETGYPWLVINSMLNFKSANFILYSKNNLLKIIPKCAKLTLHLSFRHISVCIWRKRKYTSRNWHIGDTIAFLDTNYKQSQQKDAISEIHECTHWVPCGKCR